MCTLRQQIEKVGDRILRPYVTLGTKKGEGDTQTLNVHVPVTEIRSKFFNLIYMFIIKKLTY